MSIVSTLKDLKDLIATRGAAERGVQSVHQFRQGTRERLDAGEQEELVHLTALEPVEQVIERFTTLLTARYPDVAQARGLALVHAGSARVERATGPPDQRPPDTLVAPTLQAVLAAVGISEDQFALLGPEVLIPILTSVSRRPRYTLRGCRPTAASRGSGRSRGTGHDPA